LRVRLTELRDHPLAGAALRILTGFGLFALLLPAWLLAGLNHRYDALVLATARWVLAWIKHFPVRSPELEPLAIHNQGYVLVLILAMAVVSTRVPAVDRVWRYTLLALAVFAIQTASSTAQLALGLEVEFLERTGVHLMLPWELEVYRQVGRVLFLAGIQITAFVVVALTALWNTPELLPRPEGPGRPGRTRLGVAATIVAATLLSVTTWWVREFDSRHADIHARFGHLFHDQGLLETAERQYRAAVRGGTSDGRAWWNLIRSTERRDGAQAAERLRRTALSQVSDPEWRRRIEAGP